MQIVVLLLLVAVSYQCVGFFRGYALKKGIIDHPNHRSSHSVPTPRGGGVIIPAIWLLVISFISFSYNFTLRDWSIFFIPGVVITAIGFLDDRYNTPVLLRALVHLVCAIWGIALLGIVPIFGFAEYTLYWQIAMAIFTVIAIIWSINLFNFMDGLDGFASVEAIFYFAVGGYLVYASSANFEYLAFMAWALVALLIGFLLWNKPKAKIFMGDGCSSFLGFIVAIFALYAVKNASISILLWVYLYGIFWFDASITLARRMLKGERWYQSHKLHAYQRLHQSGFSHLQVLQGQILLNVIISGLVLWAYFVPKMLLWNGLIELILLASVYYWIEQRAPMYGPMYEKVK